MATPKQKVFQTLNQTKHRINENTELSLFPEYSTNTTNDAEFWYYSDLHNLYGSPFLFAPHMDAHIWPILQMPVKTTKHGALSLTTPTIDFFNDHIVQIRHNYTTDNNLHTNAKDKKLSRYACWSMVRGYPDMIFSRTYFISPIIDSNMSFEQMRKINYHFARIHLREQLAILERQIGGILKKQQANFSLTHHIMNQAFFNGLSSQDIKEACGIPNRSNDPLANYMGAASLDGRVRGIASAIQQLNNLPKQSTDSFLELVYFALSDQRSKILQNYHTAPEHDIFKTPVSKVQSQLAQTEKEFIKKYSQQKLR